VVFFGSVLRHDGFFNIDVAKVENVAASPTAGFPLRYYKASKGHALLDYRPPKVEQHGRCSLIEFPAWHTTLGATLTAPPLWRLEVLLPPTVGNT